jgi:uncharacterized protein
LNASIIAAVAGGVAASALAAYSLLCEQSNIRVREIELAFDNLPPAFDGYTILHLSDQHLTKLGLLEKRTMEIVSRREVDCCVVTGDITANPRASDIFRRVCSAIPHRDPILSVLGNSEHKPWLDTDTIIDALTFDGLKLLINSSTTIRRGDDSITVVGLDDPYSRLHDLDAAFRGVDPKGFVVCLAHSASVTPEVIARGADLVLAGHTHGGQVRIPGVGMLWTHMRRNKSLNDGLYTSADLARRTGIDAGHSHLFVNRGVGTSKFHFRLFCRPEIVYITLRRV